MNGKTYKIYRKAVNKDEKIQRDKNKYIFLKMCLMENISKFATKDDLFNLVESVKLGIQILKTQGFPITIYEKYLRKKIQSKKA